MHETTASYCRNKHLWGDGPWVTEPDRVQWLDEESGYWCLARRNWHTGSWCGYVAIPDGHPYFRKTDRENTEGSSRAYMKLWSRQYKELGTAAFEIGEDFSDIIEKHPDYEPEFDKLYVHGGVTYTCTTEDFDISQEHWLEWRKRMLEMLPVAEEYPKGDAAEEWLDNEVEVNNFQAWQQKALTRSISLIGVSGTFTFVGFDCGHCMDLSPGHEYVLNQILTHRRSVPDPACVYRDLEYVKSECQRLALQLKEIADKPIRFKG